MNYFLLGLGGAIGTCLRYMISDLISGNQESGKFPWGTLIVNLTGSLVIGLLAGYNQNNILTPGLKLFLFAGLLGGFTTFSAFSIESLTLMKSGHALLSMIYILTSTIGAILLSFIGYSGIQYFSKINT